MNIFTSCFLCNPFCFFIDFRRFSIYFATIAQKNQSFPLRNSGFFVQ